MANKQMHVKGAGSLVLLLCLMMTTLLGACSSVSGAVRGLAGAAEVTQYYTYGTFFRLEGKLSFDGQSEERPEAVEQASLVLRSGDGADDEVYRAELTFRAQKKAGTLTFRTAGAIDEGLCLDTLPKGTFAALLETVDKEGAVHRWFLRDGTASEKDEGGSPIEYYTLTHGRGHRRVTAEFRTVSGENTTLVFNVKGARLPQDVYDIVIDPGHGGKDPGAESGSYREADIVLDMAKNLKSVLEQAGYKVLLTRDGSEDPDVNMAYTLYDKDGRVNKACASRAKLSLSIHLNHSPNAAQNGVQIYRSKKASDAFAASVARAVAEGTGLSFSTMAGKTAPGVYTRTFTAADLKEERAKAKAKGFSFYDATTSTDYYFMIREFGGIATGAYVDGRNPDYGTNEYRNSRQGVEGLLCELGFLTNAGDRAVQLQDQRELAAAVRAGVDRYIDRLYTADGAPSADLLAKENV